jgi:hypothetical protein
VTKVPWVGINNNYYWVDDIVRWIPYYIFSSLGRAYSVSTYCVMSTLR